MRSLIIACLALAAVLFAVVMVPASHAIAAPSDFVLMEPARGGDGAALVRTDAQGRELPVLRPLADPERARAAQAALNQGFPAELPKLDAQARALDPKALSCPGVGPHIILFFSDEDGGFPRKGFYLAKDEGEPVLCDDHFVDVTVDKASIASGEFEEVMTHEYGHVLLRRVLGEVPATGSRKFHTARTITDRVTGFDEGFGEHFQPLTLATTTSPGFRARATGLRAPALIDAWYSREETWLRQAWAPQDRFVLRKIEPQVADPYGRWREEERSTAFDPCRLKSGAQQVASEGLAATFFYKLAVSGSEAPPTPAELARFYGRALPVLARTGGWTPGRAPLVAFVEAWGQAYPEDRRRVTDLFLAATFGATASRQVAGLEEKAMCLAANGDMAGFQTARKAAEQARKQLLEDVLAGRTALDAAIGPELWIAVPDEPIATAPWRQVRDAPLVLDLNTATPVELRLALWKRGFAEPEFSRLQAARDTRDFESFADLVIRAGLSPVQATVLTGLAEQARILQGAVRR